MSDEYANAVLQRVFAEDPAIAEQGIEVDSRRDRIVLRGQVETERRRDEIGRRVADLMPGRTVQNEIVVVGVGPPAAPESLQ